MINGGGDQEKGDQEQRDAKEGRSRQEGIHCKVTGSQGKEGLREEGIKGRGLRKEDTS